MLIREHPPVGECCEWVDVTKRVPKDRECGERDSRLPEDWPWSNTRNRTGTLRIVVNHGSAGFFAYLLFVLNQLIFARKHGLVPFVELGRCTVNGHDHYASGARNLYYDESHGPNVWAYFFEPVATALRSGSPSKEDVVTLPSKMQWWLHHQAKGSVYAHYYGRYAHKRNEGYDRAWYLKMRRRAHATLMEHIHVKPLIAREVDAFWSKHLAHRQPVLGIHARGTDKKAEIAGDIVHPQQYVRHIKAYVADHPNATLFVATDSPSFLRWLEHKFPSLVVRNALRSERNAFLDAQLSDNYRKGADALIDALLLSRCDFLLKCSSALGEFAIYFNPSLHERSVDVQFEGAGSSRAPTVRVRRHADKRLIGTSCASPGPGCRALVDESSCAFVHKTDICSTLLNCGAAPEGSPVPAVCTPIPTPASYKAALQERWRLEAYGILRAVVSPLAARLPQWQRPSLSAVRAAAAAGCEYVVDLVLPRCWNPVLSFIFASLARIPARSCLRVHVYEMCANAETEAHLSLDARDSFAGISRLTVRPLALDALALEHARIVGERRPKRAAQKTWFLPSIDNSNASDRLLSCMESERFWTPTEDTVHVAIPTGAAVGLSQVQLERLKSVGDVKRLGGVASLLECTPRRLTRQRKGKFIQSAVTALFRTVHQHGGIEVSTTGVQPPVLPSTSTHLPQVHLSCIEPDYMLYNRQLLPAYRDTSSPCDTRWEQNASVTLQRALRRLHSGRDCGKKLQTRLLPAGWFSTIHGLVKSVMYAMRSGRGLLTPMLNDFTSQRTCSRRDLACFFKRLSHTCDADVANTSSINLNDDRFIRSESYEVHGRSVIPAAYRAYGWFWWVSQILRFVLRPSTRLEIAVRRALRDTGLGEELLSQRPVMGLHIRHGDACLRGERRRMARTCTPLAEYMQMAGPYARSLGVSVIYLATDSELVLNETDRFPEFRFIYLPNVTRYGVRNQPPSVIWDSLVAQRAKTDASHETFLDAWMASIDMLLLSRCHIFVGKFTSTLFRTAYSLHSARCSCAAPFISLDAPWCFDYGVRSGANWEFPVSSSARDGADDNRFWC